MKDDGKQLNLKELKNIVSSSNERIYEWLHNLCGLYIDTAKTTELEKPHFIMKDVAIQTSDE